ncbi:hypothetical protein BCR37DRAFT_384520 [Protomyces lactucae-debilis]|uniref:RRM domain-containing protein n=1 Tax=Protomyces lactucae-debilis TaxID=2754530 RepID=A0A1Y2EU54_PROLT|nr:uncharacterized protein BCR37DRAFT_384520 [Protomyces lactucae-debilis]ORY74385.1 hypothetical protein BCR37DRAFT_384520 [Protomyces lactucae-debilis]
MSSPPNFLSFADLKMNNNRIASPIQSPFLSPFPSSPSSPGVEPRRTKSRHMDAFSFFDSKAPPPGQQQQQQQQQQQAPPLSAGTGISSSQATQGLGEWRPAANIQPPRNLTPLQGGYPSYEQSPQGLGSSSSRWEAPGAFSSGAQSHAQQQHVYPISHPQQQMYPPQQQQSYGHPQSMPRHHGHYGQPAYPQYNHPQQSPHHGMPSSMTSGYRSLTPTGQQQQQAPRPMMARQWSNAQHDPFSRDLTPLASPGPATPGIGTVIGDDGDEVISTAVVVKNIPFSLKKETLLELFDQLTLPKPYAFNYHFDNGTFRGLAFANFHSPEETQHVIGALNGYELIGRKLRVEYKKVLPADQRERIELQKRQKAIQEEVMLGGIMRPSSAASFSSAKGTLPSVEKAKPEMDLNDPATLQIYSSLLLFRDDTAPTAQKQMAFPPEFTPPQRRTVHLIAQKLGLAHVSRGEGEERYVVVSKPIADTAQGPLEQQQPQRTMQQPYSGYTPAVGPQQALRIDTKPDLKPRVSYNNNGVSSLSHLQPPGLKQMKSYSDLRQPSPLRTSAALSSDAFGRVGEEEERSGSPAPFASFAGVASGTASPMLSDRFGEMQLSAGTGPASAPVRQPKGPEPQRAFLGRTASLRSTHAQPPQ